MLVIVLIFTAFLCKNLGATLAIIYLVCMFLAVFISATVILDH